MDGGLTKPELDANDRINLPARFIAEEFRYTVSWNGGIPQDVYKSDIPPKLSHLPVPRWDLLKRRRSSIETGQFNPTAKLALILCIALNKKFKELFYFD